ncbi:MAG: hypothetical protein R6T96_16405 [Longimicrobiales bacterium]
MPSRRERFEKASREARESTNRALADEFSELTVLDADEVERLLPRKVDKERFADLMAIVAAGTDDNTKVAALKDRFDEFGGVLVKVLKTLL